MAIEYGQQRILIVDSSGNMRATLRDMLRNIGFTNIQVMTMSRSVLELLEFQNFNIVLIGHNETDQFTGLQLLEEARFRDITKPTTSWVLMTSDSSQQSLLFALEEEPDEIIIKPFSMEKLRQRLVVLCKRRQALEPIERVLARNAPKRAIQLCDTEIDKSHPYYDQVQFIKAKLLLETDQVSAAEQIFDRYYWKDKSAKSGLYLAKCWYEEGKLVEAQSLLQNLIKETPLLIAAYDLLSLVHEVQGHLDEAKNTLIEAVRRSPMVIHRQMETGRVLTRIGHLEQAQHAYKKSVDLGENSCKAEPNAYLGLANVHRLQMESQEPEERHKAIEGIDQILNKGQKRFPNNPTLEVQSAMFLAKVYEDIEDEEEAASFREKAEAVIAEHSLEMDLEAAMDDIFEPKAPVAPEPIAPAGEAAAQATSNPEMSAKVNRIGIRNYMAGKPGQAIRHFVSAFEQDNHNGSALLNLSQLFLEAARDNPERSGERLKMVDRYLKLASRVTMDEQAKAKYQQIKTLRDSDIEKLPQGPLAELLK